ncbi:uncharacterized protein LOC109853902 [Pseudomyrmex gracilis]|uniref:uncharacterized protein LOC109853902 n=1 Tax=Pseudomyrmex gracilis TaxID=219809 RepID=UPI000994C5B8|nr:uncharacterized protein LOC109853902 [Pseudomyrmex gracilis]
MTAFPQFDSHISDENAKKALESYVGILQEAFKHYQNLLDNYIKLQEEHKQCSSQFLSKVDKPCTRIKEELLSQTCIKEEVLSQKQLNIQDSKQENNILLPELDISYSSDTSPHKNNSENTSPKSPILCKTYLNDSNAFTRNLMQLDSVYDNSTSNMKTYHSNKEVSEKCNSNLELSTSQHVETTFLSDGRKLKQTRLVFKKVPSTNVNQPDLTDILPKVQQNSREDISVLQASTTEDSNITNVNETVIDISPTQRDVMSKLRRCLQLKRKLPSRNINTFPKKKNNSSDHKDVIPILTVTDIDSESCTPKHPTQMENYKSFIKHFDTPTVNSPLKDNTTASPLVEINNIPDVQIISPEKTKKTYQLGTDRIQCTSENKNNCPAYEEETFCFSIERSMNRYTDDSNLDNTENRPPVKKLLLNSSSKTEDVPEEQLNMRCKSDRAKLRGRDCWECEEYYKNLALPKEELQNRKNYCSRHRDKYERANTPEGFWDPEFPETLSSTYK